MSRESESAAIKAAWITGGLGLIGTIAALIAGNLGLGAGVLPSKPAATDRVTTTVTVPASPGIDSTTPTGSASSGVAPEVMHAGNLDLALNAQADLDSPPSDATWRVVSLPQGASADIQWQGGGLIIGDDAQGFVSGTKRPDCRTSSGYGTSLLDLQSKPLGTFLCIYTNEKHYSLLKLTRYRGNDGASFEVTTYN
ncbi:hypothetical protein [Kribbella sp. NPDC049584]|uniref:hypothetical protein n=1 Tax=Kribbella sp. NPDC049584 TaxID=3154833 RepID=UPI003437C871